MIRYATVIVSIKLDVDTDKVDDQLLERYLDKAIDNGISNGLDVSIGAEHAGYHTEIQLHEEAPDTEAFDSI